MSSLSTHISIVSPVYSAEKLILILVENLMLELPKITDKQFEIILVEDQSPDNSWEEIKELCDKYSFVKGIKLSRNFGQHYAITAGLQAAKGEWVVVMDCDMQDRPDQIGKLYAHAQKGFHLVFARRLIRKDRFLKRTSSKLFYWVFSYLTDTKLDATIANFGIYNRQVIDAVLTMGDHIRYFPTMSQWVGFNKGYIDIEHGAREIGKSSYTTKKLFELAWNNMIAFSDKPLQLTVRFGLIMSFLSGSIGLWYIYKYMQEEIEILGFTSLMVSIWFLSGIIVFTLGIVGIYVGKTFERTKDRPLYIIEEKTNF